MASWNDYEAFSTEALIALRNELLATPEEDRCDNFAPGTCCDQCNLSIITRTLTERLSRPIKDGE